VKDGTNSFFFPAAKNYKGVPICAHEFAFVSRRLRRENDLVEIETEVDPYLELAEIHRRVIENGSAALFFKTSKARVILLSQICSALRNESSWRLPKSRRNWSKKRSKWSKFCFRLQIPENCGIIVIWLWKRIKAGNKKSVARSDS
jgi:hypothetical protein